VLILSACSAGPPLDPHQRAMPDAERMKIASSFLRETGRNCPVKRYRVEGRDSDGSIFVKQLNKTDYAPSTNYLVTCRSSVYTLEVPDDAKYRPYLMRCRNGKQAYRRGCSWFH
jgi:hypothetical protein